MQNMYEVLQKPTKELLKLHEWDFFDPLIAKYPNDYEKIIAFTNDCYNFKSPHLVQEKVWEILLLSRFKYHQIPEELKPDILELRSGEFVVATDSFMKYQQDSQAELLLLKMNLQVSMKAKLRDYSVELPSKKLANEFLNSLEAEITAIHESMMQARQPLNNGKGYDAIVSAKNKSIINLGSFASTT